MVSGGCVAAVAIGAFAAMPGLAAPKSRSTTFSCTGAEQTYFVPNGTKSLTITAVGAPGAATPPEGNGTGLGGLGADVTATVPLQKKTSAVYVEVGCPAPDDGAVGGFNGGGSTGPAAGGGGGASDLRLQSLATSLTTDDSRLVVAGGGGGAGAQCSPSGGSAGDTGITGAGAGGKGKDEPGCAGVAVGGTGGFGGTSGGAGGAGTADYPFAGGDGSLGLGGNGDTADDFNFYGGGGGGGYYGGGVGGDGDDAGGGAGAGSSFWIADASSTSMSTDSTGTPQVVISLK